MKRVYPIWRFINNVKGDLINIDKPEYLDRIIKVYERLGTPYSNYAKGISVDDWYKYGDKILIDNQLKIRDFIMFFVGSKGKIFDSEEFDWYNYLPEEEKTDGNTGDIGGNTSNDQDFGSDEKEL